ncbi:ATP-binding protein [Myxococcus sp. RHSTA-1-4]|uniref:sensor histidine kinase n=1 Tax=Myxococcus sp. RHSTA-1-4 TaxID=2874601 RepID=UPI001CBB1985|nr:ATP-binding protein [Myxococcus sp. RHSTA-1-4]MBZ4418479.1 PAS domain-containing protein [Myxococcus sp. RHSTA-1-4]
MLADDPEHRQWLEELLTSEERLRTLVDASPDPIYLKDGEGRWLKANDAGLEVFQLQGVHYQGKTDLELAELADFYREALRYCYQTDQRAWERGTHSRAEEAVPQPDGTLRYIDVTKVPLFYPDGRRKGLVVLGRDITERKRAEQERDRLLGREQALARIGQVLVSEVEPERIAEVVIEQSHRVLGADGVGLWLAHLERRELTLLASHGLSLATVESLRHLSFDSPFLTAQAARLGQPQVIEDSTAPGTPIRMSLLSTEQQARGLVSVPLRVDERLVGVMTYYTEAPRPVSLLDLEFHNAVGHLFAVALEKARLFQQLRETLRLREEFMSAAAHELKTPLTAIQMWAQLLLRMEHLTAQQQKGLTAITQHTRRMTRLVEHLLAAVRKVPGPPRLECQRFDLTALLDEAAERAARTGDNPIQIEAARPLEVVADRRILGEAIGHLLENALRYSGPGQPVEVEAHQVDGEEVRVTVRDHGPGISPERLRHVFEPLYEPIPPGASGYTGVVSLGLYLSRQHIEAHQGHISVESAPGQGSTFSISLPRLPPGAEARCT